MNLELENKVAIVGGSSKGLGKAIALRLAEEGASVTICARGEDALLKTQDEIQKKTGQDILAVQADLSKKEEVSVVVEKTLETFSRVDILVTNAGGPPPLFFMEISDEQWEAYLQVSLMSAIRLIRLVLPHMVKQNWGRILNLTSVSVKQPIDNLILSNTARLGIVGLARTLANQYAKNNITINNVAPGYVLTDRVRQLFEAKAQQEKRSLEDVTREITKQIPMGRLGKPEEIGDIFAFLASERAGYITGVTLQVDGGFVKSSL
ncbi:MAG: SDR family oxidoreductase [Calditrichaeota bacterium]|nr:SDR family oxidoreductase [Calditrichota bacterium]